VSETFFDQPKHPLCNLPAGVRPVARHAWIATANLDPFAWLNRYAHDVVQGNALIDGQQTMKAVRPRRADLQAEINFGERTECDRHGEWSVAESQWLV
jgi:hypothetical protein